MPIQLQLEIMCGLVQEFKSCLELPLEVMSLLVAEVLLSKIFRSRQSLQGHSSNYRRR